MAIRDPYVVGSSSFDVEEMRVAEAAHWAGSGTAYQALTGILPGPNNPGNVTATGTPDGFVHVAPFQAVIQSTRASSAGTYIFTNDGTYDVNVLATPANATNPRNDLVIAFVPDTFYGDANSTPVIRTVVGTPSGSPADPSLASFPNALTLARVRVNANATTITSGNITDLRPVHTVTRGGVLPTATATTRNALTGLWDGLTIYRRDRDWTETYDGASWRVNGVPIVANSTDLSAITAPFTGQVAYSTGDGLMYRYTGSAWRVQGLYSVTQTLGGTAASVTFSSIPTYLKTLTLTITCACTGGAGTITLGLRINNDSTAVYGGQYYSMATTSISSNAQNTQTSARVGAAPIGTTNKWSATTINFAGWNNPHTGLNWNYVSESFDTAANSFLEFGGWAYSPNGPYNRIDITPSGGSFAAGSQFTLTGAE